MPKLFLLEEQLWYYLTHSWEDEGVHAFLKGIYSKVNVIARLENELAYYDSAVHRFNHYTTRTPSLISEACYLMRYCILHSTNSLGKGMNPIILPPAMGK